MRKIPTQLATSSKIAVHQSVIFSIGLICGVLVITVFGLSIGSSSNLMAAALKPTKNQSVMTNRTCGMDVIKGKKVYRGCDIDYSQFSLKPVVGVPSAKLKADTALAAKLKALPKDRQAELNYQLKQTQDVIQAKGGGWKAGWNSKMILDDKEKKNLTGLLDSPPTQLASISLSKDKILLSATSPAGSVDLPDFYDWRSMGGKNYITSVRDQGNCGSCWAFASIAAFEGHIQAYYNNSNIATNLAEQDLVSCVLPYNPSVNMGGCRGAYYSQIETIFSSYWINPGNAIEANFPYVAANVACSNKQANWQQNAWKTMGYKPIDLTGSLADRVSKIKQAIIENGPVAAGMLVYNDFFNYQSGIYQHTTEDAAGGHMVAIVGFGKEDGRDYWIAKNSWGSNWGENGYFKIAVGDSFIDYWHVYAVNIPNPPASAPQSAICTDNDSDGYCYWGLDAKPTATSTCPSSCLAQSQSDCDDSKSDIYQNCGKTTDEIGTLSITSATSQAEVYVKDFGGAYIYRGKTPLTINLGVGNREIKVSKDLYSAQPQTVTIRANETVNLNVTLNPPIGLRAGWPIDIGNWNFASSPAIADINNDGKNEIIVASGRLVAGGCLTCKGLDEIQVYDQDGRLLPGWPFVINMAYSNQFREMDLVTNPTVVDLDKDGKKEIVFEVYDGYDTAGGGDQVAVYALRSDGTVMDGWPIKFGNLSNFSINSLAADDIDNDGEVEIVVALDYKIHVLDKAGRSKTGWPRDVDCAAFNEVAIGDLNNDNSKEIIYTCDSPLINSKIYVFKNNGVLMSGFPKDFAYGIKNSVVGDIDNDKNLDIIFTVTGDGVIGDRIYALNSNGTVKNGFPVNSSMYIGSLSLGDIDNDNNAEIIFASGGYLNALKKDGSQLSGWPVAIPESTSMAVISDVNNDGFRDIIFAAPQFGSRMSGIYAYSYTGNLLPGWPKNVMGSIWYESPAIGDVTGDGKLDLIATGVLSLGASVPKALTFYELGVPYSFNELDWPQFQYDPQHTACYNCEKAAIPPAITVVSPNGSEKWRRGKIYNITWSATGAAATDKINISIDNYAINATTSIVSNLAGNLLSYSWSIPSTFAIGGNYKMKVEVCRQATCYSDESNNYFSIIDSAVPNAPKNLVASAGTGQVNLTWTDWSSNEDGFKVERAASLSGPFSEIAVIPTPHTATVSYVDAGLSAGIYYYRVRAYNTAGNSGYTNIASAKLGTDINQAPIAYDQSVVTVENKAKSFTLKATDADGDTLSYPISDRTTPSHGTLTGTAPNLIYTPAANYHGSDLFTFKAYDGKISSNAATVSITITATIPNAPKNLSASAGTDQVNLSWTDWSGNEDGFKIERATSLSGPFAQIASILTPHLATTTYPDIGLGSGIYYYKVRAYNTAGNSGYSNTAKVSF
ncbi:MAG: C1 family peptidase [Candidatus Buchananbacteria bacterium]